jgi:FixJ family two-component response regulator
MELVVNEGMSNREIAAELGISAETVKLHLHRVMNKTGYSTKLELAVRTLQNRSAQEKDERVEPEFLRAVQKHIKYFSKTERDWMLEVVKDYSQRLRAGKILPKSVKVLQ